jgi:hypothetical protein
VVGAVGQQSQRALRRSVHAAGREKGVEALNLDRLTMRYSHLSPDARRDAVRLLDIKEALTMTW